MFAAVPLPSADQNPRPTQMAEAFRNLQQVVQQCQDAVFITDARGLITRINPAFENLTGYPELDLVGKDMSLITEEGAQSGEYQRIWRHAFENKQYTGTTRWKSKSGEFREASLIVTPVRGAGGRLVSLVGTARLIPTNNRRQDEAHAEAARIKRLFHDLGNILMVVVAHTELANQSLSAEAPAHRHVESAKSAALSAAAMIRQFRRPAKQLRPESRPATISGRQTSVLIAAGPGASAVDQQAESCSATLLLVDDESMILNSNADFLRAAGYSVLCAGTGGEALDIAGSHRGNIDVLITDVVLPQVSGPEIAEAIAASHPETNVLAISAHPEECVLMHPRVQHFLGKPFSRDALRDKVREILSDKKPARSVGAP